MVERWSVFDGGPAFPLPDRREVVNAMPEVPADFGSGLTIRDWFAGQALAGIIANPGTPDQMIGLGFQGSKDLLAAYAYASADAMLKAREGDAS